MYLNIPIETLLVSPTTPLQKVMQTIGRGNKQISLVVDEGRRLIGTITDGDIRRAILNDIPMSAAAAEVAQTSFTVGNADMGRSEVFELLRSRKVRHLPLVDSHGIVVDLAWLSDLIDSDDLGISAVVMAGGAGLRLKPLTDDIPKPLLPVGDRPLLEIIVQQLRDAGIQKLHLATHHLESQISEHFGDGSEFSVEISYLQEDQPMGTAGALGMMEVSDQPLLVINGDILTNLDFRAMLEFHQDHQAVMTIAAKPYRVTVPFGVLETSEANVIAVTEKPEFDFFVNAGIYLLSPEAQRCVPAGHKFDMIDLIKQLIDNGRPVISFPVQEYWLDIGDAEAYEQAQADRSAGAV